MGSPRARRKSIVSPGQKNIIRNNNPPPPEQWYDVQDEDGHWRVGFCEKHEANYKLISLDGFHPCHNALYCEHSAKILPIRTKTRGLTVPLAKTLRKILSLKEMQQISGKLSLLQLRGSQMENSPESIKSVLRTELLITIDKIFSTPFEVLNTIKMVDIHINKLFINVVQYYLKLLQTSKKFFIALDLSESAIELFRATYQMAIIIQMILGIHPRSKAFYQSQFNRTVTSQGFLDCFIKSEAGILPFKLFFKSAINIKSIDDEAMIVCIHTINLFISICEKYQKEFVEGKFISTTCIIVEEIIGLIQFLCDKSGQMRAKIKEKKELISRIQTLFLKLFPSKVCNIKKMVEGEQKSPEQVVVKPVIVQAKKSRLQELEAEKIKEMQNKIRQLQQKMAKIQTISLHGQALSVDHHNTEKIQSQPTQNLGEQAFLGSLEWALESGDMGTCRKLISWRRSLLKLGRITGWQIALSVGMKTFKRKQIFPQDIIEANYQFLMKQCLPS